ncbi:DUF2189 domain-containing protein [Blastochloris tepida]|jgi:uncharacterized membrane protein|uniref:Membrane protein n=1 Tax=Blastochloris tepida TaxID=2233851 RepID=A0A348G266_9HYPH|nr:DUF2189 domain-containing protein [Blastochloris tepida]BBF93649.1 membrane protein [Blastochloris tepida]
MTMHVNATDGPVQNARPLARALPSIRRLTRADIKAVIAAGIDDFKAAPQFGLFFGGIYAAAGLAIVAFEYFMDWTFLVFPMTAGFVLIGPFVAVGLYEVSRRRERGLPLTWSAILGAIHGQSGREIAMLGVVQVFALIIWVKLATYIYAIAFGLHPVAPRELLDVILTTPTGLGFFVFGNVVGAMLAAVVFSISVVSFPYLLDRDVDFATAMAVSVRAVLANPGPMFAFALIVASALVSAAAALFLLLPVALPVLGHATWHLYRRVIVSG